MENFFVESLLFEHETLCEIDDIFIEFAEGAMITNGEYLIEEANSKSQNLFSKLLNMIKSMLSRIKKFFLGDSDKKKDEAVDKMQQLVEEQPDIKNKTKKVIDPRKVMKLSKEDLKKGVKSVVPCLVAMSIPTAIGIYRDKIHKIEAQRLEGQISKLKRLIEDKNKEIGSVNEIIRERNSVANRHNNLLNRYNDQKKVIEDDKNSMNEQNKKINQLEEENKNLKNSMGSKAKENENLKNQLAKNKKEVENLTEELNVKNQQLELLIKSKQQIEEIATGKSVDSSEEQNDPKKYNQKDVLKKLYDIYRNIIGVYKMCNKNVTDDTIVKDIKNLYISDKTVLSDIDDTDVAKNSNKTKILGLYKKIQDSIKYLKNQNIDEKDFNELAEKSIVNKYQYFDKKK